MRLSAAGRRRVRRASPRQYGDLAGLNGILDGPHSPALSRECSPIRRSAKWPAYLAHLTADGFTPESQSPGQTGPPARQISARMQVIAEDTGMEERACEFILDAILGVGIQRMRLMDRPCRSPSDRSGTSPPAYLARVPVDNWIPDPVRRRPARAQYVADRYLVDRTMLLGCPRSKRRTGSPNCQRSGRPIGARASIAATNCSPPT